MSNIRYVMEYIFITYLFFVINSAYVDWKTFLSRLNIAGPKPG
jgi:hypothetical protein